MKTLHALLGPEYYERLHFTIMQRYIPHLDKPRSFSERVIHRKLRAAPDNAPQLVDKYAVRDFVRARIGDEHLIPLVWSGDDISTLDWATLPSSFVAKGTHGSGGDYMMIVRDKNAVNEADFRARCERILHLRYLHTTNEKWYRDVPPRIIIESLLVDITHGTPPDFKFFVFNGRVHCVQVDMDRFENHRRTFYDRDWKPMPFRLKFQQANLIPRPKVYSQMIDMAEKLAAGLDFVRVDLYCIDDSRIYFGEMTLAPGAGREWFVPREYDFELGKLWVRAA